ncbi:unnamed protein product [Rotaria sordida]|uniref:Uncharacterized protein n=1 Tax=Rotaria sordida TaxID=392033 RepID=A0A814BHP3_9BILA|nr:unnamed protein product [Rotaria sordida]CAF0978938.1 unnamed protein product [Rotaria sordida]
MISLQLYTDELTQQNSSKDKMLTHTKCHFDCARILLSSIDDLAKIDITDIVVLDILRQSRIQHMILIVRRRRIQILSFTIKEFRELTTLTGLQSI